MYQDLIKIIHKRFSCRNYDENFKIPQEDIEKIVTWAYLWPSSYALWPFELVVVSNSNTIKLISNSIKEHRFCEQSSLLIFVCQKKLDYTDKDDEIRKLLHMANEWHLDAAIAGTYIDLIATSLWYNTIWMWYYENQVGKKILRLPEDLWLLYYIAIGKLPSTSKAKKHFFNTGYQRKIHDSRYGNYLFK